MIRSLYRNGKGSTAIDVPVSHWRAALKDPNGMLWVDVGGESEAKIEPLMREIFEFHPLAIDDALRESHVPKIDNWGAYLYAVVHSVVFDADSLALLTTEVDLFIGRNYLVTTHHGPVDAIDRLWNICQRDSKIGERGTDFLLYNLLDMVASDYLPAMDALDEALDRLEDEVFSHPTTQILNTLFQVKRAVLHLRRVIGPQREVLNRLARDPYEVIDAEDRVYYRDVYDHFVRLVDINETLRDLVGGTLDTYLSVTSNRTNDIMKVLTIFTALFMPLTFITGFFGMNFEFLPFRHGPVFWLSLGGMLLLPLVMLLWFRRIHWL